MNIESLVFELPNGVCVFNATPHPLTFDFNGERIEVPVLPPEYIISADVLEQKLGSDDRVEFVTPIFEQSLAAWNIIEAMRPNVLIVGSIIAAQAYPASVVALVPAQGYERVPPDKKRMRCDKFIMYSNREGN